METTTSTVGSCSSPQVVLWGPTSCECDKCHYFCCWVQRVVWFIVFVLFRMVLILHQSGASHGHSHMFPSSQLQRDKQRQSHGHHHGHGNASVKAAFIHVLGDLVQSVGVLLAATIIHFWVSVKTTH